jgi:hypothetical protein
MAAIIVAAGAIQPNVHSSIFIVDGGARQPKFDRLS